MLATGDPGGRQPRVIQVVRVGWPGPGEPDCQGLERRVGSCDQRRDEVDAQRDVERRQISGAYDEGLGFAAEPAHVNGCVEDPAALTRPKPPHFASQQGGQVRGRVHPPSLP